METTSKYWYFVGRPCGMQKKILAFLEETGQPYTVVPKNSDGKYIPDVTDIMNAMDDKSCVPVFVLLDGINGTLSRSIWVDDEEAITYIKALSEVEADCVDNAIEAYEVLEDHMLVLHLLVKSGLSKNKIESLSKFCRLAQGITKEQENLAELAIRKSESTHGLYIVYLPHNEIATVTDRLFWQQQFPSLLIITPQQVYYCGFHDTITTIVKYLQEALEKDTGSIASVVTEANYLSIKRSGLNAEELALVVKKFKRLACEKFGDLM